MRSQRGAAGSPMCLATCDFPATAVPLNARSPPMCLATCGFPAAAAAPCTKGPALMCPVAAIRVAACALLDIFLLISFVLELAGLVEASTLRSGILVKALPRRHLASSAAQQPQRPVAAPSASGR